jgi:hypothetical protein
LSSLFHYDVARPYLMQELLLTHKLIIFEELTPSDLI